MKPENKLQIEYVNIQDIVPYENNPRKILKNILKNSEIWSIKKDYSMNYIHPTQKPIDIANIIERWENSTGNKGVKINNSNNQQK
jgi:hypothetical protein